MRFVAMTKLIFLRSSSLLFFDHNFSEKHFFSTIQTKVFFSEKLYPKNWKNERSSEYGFSVSEKLIYFLLHQKEQIVKVLHIQVKNEGMLPFLLMNFFFRTTKVDDNIANYFHDNFEVVVAKNDEVSPACNHIFIHAFFIK